MARRSEKRNDYQTEIVCYQAKKIDFETIKFRKIFCAKISG
jgi:hypothetical protein